MSGECSSIIDCRPGDSDVCVKVKVLQNKVISDNSKKAVSECLVGDSTACILFTARREQCEKLQVGSSFEVKGAKVDMYRGSMRLSAPAEASVEEYSGNISVNKDMNMSLLEFETVIVAGANDRQKNGTAPEGAEPVEAAA